MNAWPTHVIDFRRGETACARWLLSSSVPGGRARMVVTLSPMHDGDFTRMQQEGFASQLSKLDKRYGWQA
jgi:hypothetical protein